MYMHSTHAHALHKRTSLPTPLRAAERSMAVIMAAIAAVGGDGGDKGATCEGRSRHRIST